MVLVGISSHAPGLDSNQGTQPAWSSKSHLIDLVLFPKPQDSLPFQNIQCILIQEPHREKERKENVKLYA